MRSLPRNSELSWLLRPGPVVEIDGQYHGKQTSSNIVKLLSNYTSKGGEKYGTFENSDDLETLRKSILAKKT
jgi:hypothetical protein